MIIQDDAYSCGPHAIVNALAAIGQEDIDVLYVVEIAQCTKAKGTNEKGIVAALNELGYDVNVIAPFNADNLFGHVCTSLDQAHPVILLVDGVDHWIAVVGTIGWTEGTTRRLIIFDSENTASNREFNGVHIYDKGEFDRRCGGSRYAISVVRQGQEYQHQEDQPDYTAIPGPSFLAQLLNVGVTPKFAKPLAKLSDNDGSTADATGQMIADAIFNNKIR